MSSRSLLASRSYFSVGEVPIPFKERERGSRAPLRGPLLCSVSAFPVVIGLKLGAVAVAAISGLALRFSAHCLGLWGSLALLSISSTLVHGLCFLIHRQSWIGQSGYDDTPSAFSTNRPWVRPGRGHRGGALICLKGTKAEDQSMVTSLDPLEVSADSGHT